MTTAKKIADTFFPVIDSPAGQWMNDNLKRDIKEYATQVAQDALNRAAENARTKDETEYINVSLGYQVVKVVDRESIADTEIILP